MLSVLFYQSLTCVGILAHSSFLVLLEFIGVWKHLFLHSFPATAFQCGWDLDFATPCHCSTLILYFLSHSVVDLLLSLSCCMTEFQPSLSCQTDDLTFDSRILEELMIDSMTARCVGPVAAKQAQNITSPTLCLQLIWGVWFPLNLVVWNKHLYCHDFYR